jgi:hypothetical protein
MLNDDDIAGRRQRVERDEETGAVNPFPEWNPLDSDPKRPPAPRPPDRKEKPKEKAAGDVVDE